MSLPNLTEELAELERRGLRRRPRTIDGAIGPTVTIEGREVLLLCSNDYLGLSGHPALRAAAIEATERYGVGACSSRLVSGTLAPHRELEDHLASWLGAAGALFFPAGFMTNLAVISTLAGREDVVFSDRLNHASIVSGCRLGRAKAVEVYRHLDVDHLDHLLSLHRAARRRLIVTDALFSVDGDAAPLTELAELALRHRATLVVDEAHSLGALGPSGRGLCAERGVVPDLLVGTFGKAFGCSGAFVAAQSAAAIALLESRAVPFMYTTAPPPALAAAISAALTLIEGADEARAALARNAERLRSALSAYRRPPGSRYHIVPVIVPGVERALRASSALLDRGVFAQALRAPTVAPGTERIRMTPTSLHRSDQIDHAARSLVDVLEHLDAPLGSSQPHQEVP